MTVMGAFCEHKERYINTCISMEIFLLRWQVKNKTDTGHTLYVTSSPVMHLVLMTHETVTSQRRATYIVSYIQANRKEWEVRVDRRGEPNFLRRMLTQKPTKQHTFLQQRNRRNLKLPQSPNLPIIAINSIGSIVIAQFHPCLKVTWLLRKKRVKFFWRPQQRGIRWAQSVRLISTTEGAVQ
jgi:hypothetical protein